jgi:hypothetical protein
MEISGKLVKKLDVEKGTSKAGKEWSKQSIVIDTGGEFNNEVCVSAFGDKMESMNKLEIGMEVKILCNVYSREYNGRYFHNIDGYHFSNVQKSEANLDVHFEGTTPDDLPF